MNVINNKIKQLKKDGTRNTEIFDINSTVANSMKLELSHNVLSIFIYIKKDVAGDKVQSYNAFKNKNKVTLTEIFGMNKIYKYCFTVIRQNTDYNKQEIADILKEDAIISNKYHNEGCIRIAIPIMKDRIN